MMTSRDFTRDTRSAAAVTNACADSSSVGYAAIPHRSSDSGPVEALTRALPNDPFCDCGCRESRHADEDYDAVGDPLRFVACPRRCFDCECRNFNEEG